MDNNHDLEQGQQVDHQMRSVRSQWIRLVLARTVLMMMVPFGGLLVLSVNFNLISLSNVMMAFVVTYVICSVLIVFALFFPANHARRQLLWEILSVSSFAHALSALLCTSSYLQMYFAASPATKSFQNIFYKPSIQELMKVTVFYNIIVSCMTLVVTALHVFRWRAHQFLTVRNAACLLSYQITLLYLYILVMVAIVIKRHYLANPFDWIYSI